MHFSSVLIRNYLRTQSKVSFQIPENSSNYVSYTSHEKSSELFRSLEEVIEVIGEIETVSGTSSRDLLSNLSVC